MKCARTEVHDRWNLTVKDTADDSGGCRKADGWKDIYRAEDVGK